MKQDGGQPAPDLRQAKEALLKRAKELSLTTEEKLRKLLDETEDKSALPPDPTDESPPVI